MPDYPKKPGHYGGAPGTSQEAAEHIAEAATVREAAALSLITSLASYGATADTVADRLGWEERYHPANNSGHLDGSALDLLPPAGKSMGWLKNEVRRLHPNARLLDEGDHLHATFPGWYGAPAIGGAKNVGLRNPMSAG